MIRKIKDIIRFLLYGDIPLFVYKKKGLKFGNDFSIQKHCTLDISHCWLIEIGNNVTLSQRVQLLAHDASTKKKLEYTMIGKIKIGNNVFIGANSIVLPNVSIGENCIIGAGSVVTKSIPANSIAAGNPAKVITSLDTFLERKKHLMNESNLYNEQWTVRGNISESQKNIMSKALENGIGFVK